MQRYFVVIPDMPVCLSERFVREKRSAMFEHVCVSEFMRERKCATSKTKADSWIQIDN